VHRPGEARHRWGEAQADALWDAANIKLIFGGLAGADELSRISRLAGDIDQACGVQRLYGPSSKVKLRPYDQGANGPGAT
jgi:hypothetical protein